MKIALVIDRLDPRRGGAEQWTWQFAHALVAMGHEVHAAAGGFSPEAQKLVVAHRVPLARSRFEFAQNAERVAREIRADVVHDMGCGWHCDVFQPHGGSRTASFEQNLLLLPPWLRPFKRALVPLLPRYRDFARVVKRQYAGDGKTIVALSKMVARDMQRFHGAQAQQLRLVYNGVDVRRFPPAASRPFRDDVRRELGLLPSTLAVLIVAHNFELKGVPSLMRAVARLKQGHDVRLLVAGGKRTARYGRLAKRLGLLRRATFLGPVADPVPYYAAADVYAHPTFYDPCSLVLLEALAMGLPVVTSRFNGAGELMTPGVEGFILDDPADDAALADRIAELGESDVRRNMAAAARALAEQHTLERNCREIVAIYETIARRVRRAA
ncbi:MAG: glycosyltransferase family 4 protein [Planctomycetia bacterium]|nr:glycosyltransferase family 4 protein [Planctomycetia bacterium]